ncbi:gliding motility-associated ABC transporter substrate-binding protein GldG [uncultured Acetobacteroides sp.]|uniref:gliding motility-associated ABC transporter substrate-binding protein GldG n=1 Tax=uncultured Acetobacteroides sp. TaxID=1760811 RepID=UPI0029F514C3|nr:gliding motility-associated ABC transporter substrate-binding protein GldG [uncultured Acetobacteroides sp.]
MEIIKKIFKKPSGQKAKSLKTLALFLGAVLVVNVAASFLFFRLDLTSDKRFTLSQVTKDKLKGVKDVVYVKVYLDGDMPIAFKKMKRSVKEMLDEFAAYSGGNVQYEFVNPAAESGKKQNALYEDLYKKGLRPVNVQEKNAEGGINQRTLFPGAIVSYNGYEIGINLLTSNSRVTPEESINIGAQNLEYNLVSAIDMIMKKELPKIAFIQGHDELDAMHAQGALQLLSERFNIDSISIRGRMGALDGFSTAIIAKPLKKWSEADKLVLDQYIMHGGKVAWFIDAITVNDDSLASGEVTFGLVNEHNLDDQLFKYGVRINPTVLQDAQSVLIPVNMAVPGAQPQFVPSPWYYYPLLNAPNDNIITKNLNVVYSKYPSSIDTVGVGHNIKKTVLLSTSQYAREIQAPVMVSLAQVTRKFKPGDFNRAWAPVAMLLEGQFASAFQNRMIPGVVGDGKPLVNRSKPTKMVVVADGDIIRNDVQRSASGVMPYPLGFDKYMNQQFGNKDFLLNAISYLNDDTGLMQIRNRELVVRMLDKNKIYTQRTMWVFINTAIPLLLLVAFSIVFIWLRKRKYAR